MNEVLEMYRKASRCLRGTFPGDIISLETEKELNKFTLGHVSDTGA